MYLYMYMYMYSPTLIYDKMSCFFAERRTSHRVIENIDLYTLVSTLHSTSRSRCPYTYQDIIIGYIVKACTAANVGKLSNADTVRRMELFNKEATGGVFDVTEL